MLDLAKEFAGVHECQSTLVLAKGFPACACPEGVAIYQDLEESHLSS